MCAAESATEALLQVINCRHEIGLRLIGCYQAGENHGAYAVVDQDGRQRVLKRQAATAAGERRLRRAAVITEWLRTLAYPAPRYLLIGTTPDRGDLYYLQEQLPGTLAGLLTEPHQLDRLLELNELQTNQAISAEQDWSAYVAHVVFDDVSGWAASLRAYAPVTARLVNELDALTQKSERVSLPDGDIVHGDFSPENILIHQGQVSGVVDWDAAGCGDRAFDLALLVFYHYDQLWARQRLRDCVVEISSPTALRIYLTYAILSQTHWSSLHHGPAAVDHWVKLARSILADFT